MTTSYAALHAKIGYAEGTDARLGPITITGTRSAQGSAFDLAPSVSELSGKRLDRKRTATVGETLSKEVGISSSSYGAGASRPVIRGLDGDRVKILQNGLGAVDASGASPDHAVAFDPLSIDRVEILRGPSALLWGNSAVGGVVNLTNSRIPLDPKANASGRVISGLSSADFGRSLGARWDSRADRFALHIDGSLRGANATRSPLRLRTIDNSQTDTKEGAVGATYFASPQVRVGASLSTFDTLYGSVAEKDVRIDLQRNRADFLAEWLPATTILETAKLSGSVTSYVHREREAGTIATTFRNQGGEVRLDLKHRPLESLNHLQGVGGVQLQAFRFGAAGEEAFLPTTQNLNAGAFAYEEWRTGRWTPSIGARLEHAHVRTESSNRFGNSAARTYLTPNVAAGAVYALNEHYALGANATAGSRAPNYQELFAGGKHVATGIFERGDRNLRSETSRSVELSFRRTERHSPGRISGFVQDFDRFITLSPTGETDADSSLPVYAFAQRRARIFGFEVEQHFERQSPKLGGVFEFDMKLDFLRGLDLGARQNLPRISPVRLTGSLAYATRPLRIEAEFQAVARQSFTAPNEASTPGYGLWNLSLESPLSIGDVQFRAHVSVQNLFDQLARNHVSFVKEQSPLVGRNFVLSLQAAI